MFNNKFGIHVGGSSSNVIIDKNNIHNNKGRGIHFCSNVQNSVFSNNIITENAHGIAGLGGGKGDRYNIITSNIITRNRRHGIEVLCARGGYNSIINNVISENSRERPGRYHGIYLANSNNILIEGNRICDHQNSKTQAKGIYVSGKSSQISILNNQIDGMLQSGIHLSSSNEVLVKGNILTNNLYGILVGADSNVSSVIGNIISLNQKDGIRCSGSKSYPLKDIIVSGNLCINNSQGKRGVYDGIYIGCVKDSIFTNNRCSDNQDAKTQNYGLREEGASNYNIITNNHLKGNIQVKGLSTVGTNDMIDNNIVK